MLLIPLALGRRPQVLGNRSQHVNGRRVAPGRPPPEIGSGEPWEKHGSGPGRHGAEKTHYLGVCVAEGKYAHKHVIAPYSLLLNIRTDRHDHSSVIPCNPLGHTGGTGCEHASLHVRGSDLHPGIGVVVFIEF